jgi:hypothetical protein
MEYDEFGNPIDTAGYNPDPMVQQQPDYGSPFANFMASPNMAMAQQALINLAALRRDQVPTQTPFSAAFDVRRQNAILMDQKYQNQQAEKRWRDGMRLRDEQLKAAQFTNQQNATAVPNPYQNLPAAIQEWKLSGSKLPFEKFIEAKNPHYFAPTQPTSVMQNFGVWQKLNPGATPEDTAAAYNSILRAGSVIPMGGGGQAYYNPLTGMPETVIAPQSATALEATQAGAETRAEETAKTDIDRSNQARTNAMAFSAYQEAMNGISNAFTGTDTGPVAGRVPAVTAAQQTAEGAVAAAAPVLKQLFRSAGEGVFTDKDQQLLMDMMPKRTDHPEVVQYKLATIDKIVAAKLGTGGQTQDEDLGSTDGY